MSGKRRCRRCGKSEYEHNLHRTTIYDGKKTTYLCTACYEEIKKHAKRKRKRKILCKDCANLDTEKCPFETSDILNDLNDYCSRAEGKAE